MQTVLVKHGEYRGKKVVNEEFLLKRDIAADTSINGSFINVVPKKGFGKKTQKSIRINVERENLEYIGKSKPKPSTSVRETTPKLKSIKVKSEMSCNIEKESDQDIIDRISERFEILRDMTVAAINSDIKAMIVSGPPGVGKSYGVEQELEKANMFNDIAQVAPRYEVIKGAMTPLGLYTTLYKHAAKDHVVVFDDCDAVLHDELSLNLLKAALDSGKRRRVYWNADSHLLRRDGIPTAFDFKGAVIFISNLNFDSIRSKKIKDHLEALQSRCHYLDLSMDSMRERILRVRHIAQTGELFKNYDFSHTECIEVIDFMDEHKDRLREMSLRMALKIADLKKISPRWKNLAKTTCMLNN